MSKGERAYGCGRTWGNVNKMIMNKTPGCSITMGCLQITMKSEFR